ncbi:uncharacterized protein LOC118450980 [Vespa mandarinia]|uniref:uncharacterized protein LOC118450980 n=1 Tax=Vespa mandarinia TaxID=7446 RepID=UPI001610FC78|nr:uncharacterized protein LOC118450980 [Vespa mandarinia]
MEIFILLLPLVKVAVTLVGYDCATQFLNITSYFLLHRADCEIPNLQPINSTGYVQLSQTADYYSVKALQCRSGTVTTDGTCKTSQYSDLYGTWDEVVVQAIVRLTLQDYIATVKTKANQIHLKSGTACALDGEACHDLYESESYWSNIPTDSSGFYEYNVLYEGPAMKLTPAESFQRPILYTVATKDVTFALTRTTSTALDKMAYTLMKQPGYMAVIAAEVMYITKCISMEVKVRQTEECYKELPITYRNDSYFLAFKTRIILKEASSKGGNELPNMYNLHGTWYRVTPKLFESISHPVIQSLTKP